MRRIGPGCRGALARAFVLLAFGMASASAGVLDVMLPGLDGFEICARLKDDPVTARLPILMFSAKAQDTDKRTGFKVGADDYLSKPAAPAEIVNRVGILLIKSKKINAPQEKVSG